MPNTYQLQPVPDNPVINASTSQSGGGSRVPHLAAQQKSTCTMIKNTAGRGVDESWNYQSCGLGCTHALKQGDIVAAAKLLVSSVPKNTYDLTSVSDNAVINTLTSQPGSGSRVPPKTA